MFVSMALASSRTAVKAASFQLESHETSRSEEKFLENFRGPG